MKPTVISNANSSVSTGSGVTIPINYEFRGQTNNDHQQKPHFNTHAQHFVSGEPQAASYGSSSTMGRGQRQQQTPSQQQENPTNFQQNFDFQPDVDIDMFPRTRLGLMTHDPFGDFGGNTRKRNSLHDPQFHTDGFSRYFDDDPDFGFPQFNSLGRRRINPHNDDDFFNRLPSEFRQYIPESFAHRRAGAGLSGNPSNVQTTQQQPQPNFYNTIPQSTSRKVCDAAIQTEDPNGRSEVDHLMNTEKLHQHGLRNTMDMGVKSPSENENQSPRSSSAPPTEQQNLKQPLYTHPQQIPINGPQRQTSSPQQQNQFSTQTNPQQQSVGCTGQSPKFQKMFQASQQQLHSQQKQQTPPPQTPGGTYIRTIPIFVEGRSEPIINNKEIPNQNVPQNVSPASARSFTPPKQQAQRPKPLNTQQQSTTENGNLPPQTPHTVDTINKIQDIQRDVLELMSRVEKFTGTRSDKEYVYLDEMLTRNLLKLDNIDTNGKESIRLARKEAIKCIQASINVLEAKAEENKKATQFIAEDKEVSVEEVSNKAVTSSIASAAPQPSTSTEKITKESTKSALAEEIEDAKDSKNNDPKPLEISETEKFNEVKIEDCLDDDIHTSSIDEVSTPKSEDILRSNQFKPE